MRSVLLVTATEKSSQELSGLLRSERLTDISPVQSGAVARLRLLNKHFDLVVINAPLEDENGLELARLAAENQSEVIVLVRGDKLDEVFKRLDAPAIHLLAKPLLRPVFLQTLRQIAHQREAVRALTAENQKLQQKLKEANLINRAKLVLIDVLKLSEPQAHRYIEKRAMDTRQSKAKVAEAILNTYEQ